MEVAMSNVRFWTISRIVLAAIVLTALGGSLWIWGGQANLGRGRINGEVVDESGVPVVGAKIVAAFVKGTTTRDGVSDKKGRFAIAGLGTGIWRITASKEGFVDSFVEMDVSQLRANPPITLTMKKLAGAQELQPDKPGIELVDRGNALLKEERYDEAIAAFDEFQAQHPDLYQIRLNIATAYLRKGDTAAAETEFKSVLDKIREVHGDLMKDPTAAVRAYSGLGELSLKEGKLEAGQGYFREALKISPEDEVAAYNVGEIFFSNQQIDEAIEYLELAAKIKKDWPKPYYRLGFVYLNKGEFDKSLENFKKFIELDPENPEVPNVRNMMAAIEKMKK
jgi:tetratricopeptide (TPR) repeat protein